MDAAGEVAQLLERGSRLRLGLVDELQRHAVGVVAQALAGHAELEARATRRCCAPSCRSRSMRRRSASAAAMIRACAERGVDDLGRELGIGLGVQQQPRPVAVGDAHAVDEVPRRDDQQRADRDERRAPRAGCRRSRTARRSRRRAAQYHRGARSAPAAATIAIDVEGEPDDPERELAREVAVSFQVCGSATRAMIDAQHARPWPGGGSGRRRRSSSRPWTSARSRSAIGRIA